MPWLHRIANALREFRHDNRGVFAVLTGILLGLLLAVVCCGIEFTQYMQARAAMQNAADAMALELVVE